MIRGLGRSVRRLPSKQFQAGSTPVARSIFQSVTAECGDCFLPQTTPSWLLFVRWTERGVDMGWTFVMRLPAYAWERNWARRGEYAWMRSCLVVDSRSEDHRGFPAPWRWSIEWEPTKEFT